MIDAHTHAPTRPDWPARAAEAAAIDLPVGPPRAAHPAAAPP